MTPEISLADVHGLYRATIAGPGRSLPDTFSVLGESRRVGRLLRHPQRDVVSARVTLAPDERHGYWELARVRSDLYVILANYSYINPRVEFVPGDGLVQFNFKLSGDMTYGIGSPGPLRFNRPALHLWRQPCGVDMREWTAPKAHERIVAISISPERLVDQFLTPADEVPRRLRAFIDEPRSTVEFCELPLTPRMVDITTKLIDNPYKASLYLAYQEALTVELLCVAVGTFLSLSSQPTEGYSDRELDALRMARALLMKQFVPPPTLGQIARTVGVSERALTRSFKAVYGETVFDFSFRCRMEHALSLLRDRAWSVDRVSDAVGYSHPTSFATAFRRHFGIRPVEMRPLKTGRRNS